MDKVFEKTTKNKRLWGLYFASSDESVVYTVNLTIYWNNTSLLIISNNEKSIIEVAKKIVFFFDNLR